jgi:hypothetical protein
MNIPANPQAKADHVTELLSDLNGGVFLEQLAVALRESALGVAVTGKAGSVTVKLSLKRIGESNQVICSHTLDFVRPTEKGKKSESSTTDTPLYVSQGGVLSLFPIQHQEPLFNGTSTGAKAGI